MSGPQSTRVILNVSGEVYETLETTLKRYPQTLLGNLPKRCCFYCTNSQQYYFNRSRRCFGAILFFYQSRGILRCPPGIPLDVFEQECVFFQIPDDFVSNLRSKEAILFDLDKYDEPEEEKQATTYKMKLWDVLENPEASQISKIFAIFSISMISVSVFVSCLGTIDALQVETDVLEKNPWLLIELSLNVWFLIELTARVMFSPSKKAFFKSSLNWVDVIAILPYFVVLIISKEDVSSLGPLKMMRFIRIVRLFRLSKHSKRLKVVGEIIKSSVGDLQLLLLCLAMVIIFGGSLMYYIEGYHDLSQFTSIPQALWWGIQTITTLGYGDIFPITAPGKLLAACFMAFGALTISLPVLSIVTKFMSMYSQNIEGYIE